MNSWTEVLELELSDSPGHFSIPHGISTYRGISTQVPLTYKRLSLNWQGILEQAGLMKKMVFIKFNMPNDFI